MLCNIQYCSLPAHFPWEKTWSSGTLDWRGQCLSAKAAVCSQQCLSELLIKELGEHREEYPYRQRPRNSPEFWFSGQSFLKCSTEPQSLQPPPSRRTESLRLYQPDTECVTLMSNFGSSHSWWLWRKLESGSWVGTWPVSNSFATPEFQELLLYLIFQREVEKNVIEVTCPRLCDTDV